MKNQYRNNTYCRMWIIIISFFFSYQEIAAQDEQVSYKMRFNLSVFKENDDTRLLKAEFYGLDNKVKIPVFGSQISFYNFLEEEEQLLGTAKTTQDGIASLRLPEDQVYLKDEEGYISFRASSDGLGQLDVYEDDIAVIDLVLSMNLDVIDSIKTITLNAYSLDNENNEIPLEEGDVFFYVQGMLSKMKIAEGWIEEGECIIEFPDDIPGNTEGELTVYATIEDSDEFGNVVKQTKIKWGVGSKIIVEEHNKLWSEAPPLWMIVTLSVLLIGVWANYLNTIINLFIIRKEGRELKNIVRNEN